MLRKNREVGDKREFHCARRLDECCVERRQRQLEAARELEVNGVVWRQVMRGCQVAQFDDSRRVVVDPERQAGGVSQYVGALRAPSAVYGARR